MGTENKKKWIILINVCLGIFMSTLDGGIVNIALPEMYIRLHVDIGTVQWVVSSYILTISALLLTFGRIADIYGRRTLYLTGYAIFTIGSILCGLSRGISFLIISRIVQAIGAAILMANSQAIVTETFPKEERGKALGITGTFVALGSLVGPGLGGILVHLFGWQSIFFINIPIGIAGFVMTQAVIDTRDIRYDQKFDYIGSIIFASGIVLLFLGLISIQDNTASMALIEVLITFSLILLAIFILLQLRASQPLLDLRLFRNTNFSLGLGAAFISFLTLFSTTILLPFYLQHIKNYPTNIAGLIMMAQPAVMALVAPMSGRMSDKIGFRKLTIAGLSINVVGLVFLSRLGIATSQLIIVLNLAFLGFGTAMFQSPNNSSIMGAVTRGQLGIAAGINSLVRNLGMISGIAFSVILFHYYVGKFSGDIQQNIVFVQSMDKVFMSAAVICVLGVIFSSIRTK